MHAKLSHIDAMVFESDIRGHKVLFDTSGLGTLNKGASPKETILSCILGCTAMDVVGLLRKNKISYSKFELTADADTVDTHPKIFKSIHVKFILEGDSITHEKVIEAVELSMTQYCGVSAMIHPTSPILYEIFINGNSVHTGKARFS